MNRDKNGNLGESKKFWKDHAIVLDGSLKIDPGSIHGYVPEEVIPYMDNDL